MAQKRNRKRSDWLARFRNISNCWKLRERADEIQLFIGKLNGDLQVMDERGRWSSKALEKSAVEHVTVRLCRKEVICQENLNVQSISPGNFHIQGVPGIPARSTTCLQTS